MRTLRITAWIAVALAVAGVTTYLMVPRESPPGVSIASIGGPFELIDQNGRTMTHEDLPGQPTALFFGFTHCPDVCPTTLFEATLWLEELGTAGDDIRFVFVTVDPERDTPEVLAEYLQAFDPRIIALSGSPEAIDEIISGYKVFAQKVPLEGEAGAYTMDHTSSIFLLDKAAQLVGTISYQEDGEIALQKLRNLAARS